MTEKVKSGRGGRRPGAGRKKISPFTQEQQELAMQQLQEAVSRGESWAITFVMSRLVPAPRPVTVEGSLDAKKLVADIELTYARVAEISDLAKRIEALENTTNGSEVEE